MPHGLSERVKTLGFDLSEKLQRQMKLLPFGPVRGAFRHLRAQLPLRRFDFISNRFGYPYCDKEAQPF